MTIMLHYVTRSPEPAMEFKVRWSFDVEFVETDVTAT